MTPADLKRIFALLGASGTSAGLLASEITTDQLKELAKKMKASPPEATDRGDLVEILISLMKQNKLKTTDDLLKMSYDELLDYFARTNADNDELLKIMKDLNYKVSAEDKKHLRRFVARQISETALFSFVAQRK